MSWSVSTWVSAGTLSRSTPDPSSGVTPTTSTGGRVKGSSALVGAASCAAATADNRTNAKAAPGKTCLRSAIFPPVHVLRRRPLRPRTRRRAFPIFPRNLPASHEKTSSGRRYAARSRGGILSEVDFATNPNVSAVSSDRPGLYRPRGQPRAGRADGLGQCVALGTHRDAFGPAGRPANDRERDRTAAECSQPVTQSG